MTYESKKSLRVKNKKLEYEVSRRKEDLIDATRQLNSWFFAFENALQVYAPEVLKSYLRDGSFGGDTFEQIANDLKEWLHNNAVEEARTEFTRRLFGPLTKDE